MEKSDAFDAPDNLPKHMLRHESLETAIASMSVSQKDQEKMRKGVSRMLQRRVPFEQAAGDMLPACISCEQASDIAYNFVSWILETDSRFQPFHRIVFYFLVIRGWETVQIAKILQNQEASQIENCYGEIVRIFSNEAKPMFIRFLSAADMKSRIGRYPNKTASRNSETEALMEFDVFLSQRGNITARNRVMLGLYPFIRHAARRLARQAGVSYDEMIQELTLQTLSSLERIDPWRGKITSYLGVCLDNHAKDLQARRMPIAVSRKTRAAIERIKRGESDREIAGETGLSERYVSSIRRNGPFSFTSLSSSAYPSAEPQLTLQDVLPNPDVMPPEEELLEREREYLGFRVLSMLPDGDQIYLAERSLRFGRNGVYESKLSPGGRTLLKAARAMSKPTKLSTSLQNK